MKRQGSDYTILQRSQLSPGARSHTADPRGRMYFPSRPGHRLLLTSTFQNFLLLRKCATSCSLKARGFAVLKDSSAKNHCSCTRTRGAPAKPRMTHKWQPNSTLVYSETAKLKIVAVCNQYYSHHNTSSLLSGMDTTPQRCGSAWSTQQPTETGRREPPVEDDKSEHPPQRIQSDLHSC